MNRPGNEIYLKEIVKTPPSSPTKLASRETMFPLILGMENSLDIILGRYFMLQLKTLAQKRKCSARATSKVRDGARNRTPASPPTVPAAHRTDMAGKMLENFLESSLV